MDMHFATALGHGGHDIHEGVCGHPGAAFYDHRLSGSPSDRSAASQPASHEGAVPGFYNYPGSGFMRDHSLSTSRATLMRDYFTAHQQMSRQHKVPIGLSSVVFCLCRGTALYIGQVCSVDFILLLLLVL